MRTLSKILFVIGIASVIYMQGCNPKENSREDSTLSMGISKMNITPAVPVRMSGYAGRTDPFSDIRDSLYTTAMVFSDGETTAAFITTDVIGFSFDFYDQAVEMIEKETGIKKGNILLSATHTHGGPVTKVYNDSLSDNESVYIKELQRKIVSTVSKASDNIRPVSLGMGMGSCNMNINRRARFADGTIFLGRNPDGPCDHDVAVVKVDDINNNPLAVIVNWPCHGTVSGARNTRITGDWPGATARFVEDKMGNDVIVPVTAGASGDINPLYGPDVRFDYIDATGMFIGETVVDVAQKIETSPYGTVDVITKTVKAKGKKRIDRKNRANRIFPQEFEPDEDVEINLSVLRAGDIVFAGISGEVMTEIGMDIKALSPVENTIVVTHCNGSSGYLCTDEAYPLGGYEVLVTRTMPGTEVLIKDNLLEMIRLTEL